MLAAAERGVADFVFAGEVRSREAAIKGCQQLGALNRVSAWGREVRMEVLVAPVYDATPAVNRRS